MTIVVTYYIIRIRVSVLICRTLKIYFQRESKSIARRLIRVLDTTPLFCTPQISKGAC